VFASCVAGGGAGLPGWGEPGGLSHPDTGRAVDDVSRSVKRGAVACGAPA